MTTPLIKTKFFMPALRADLISRPRLIDRLAAGVQAGHTLTLITAPAGFGKTTAAACWVHDNGRATAWITLEEEENDPVLFWSYFVSAFQTAQQDFGNALLGVLNSPRPPLVRRIVTELVNQLAELSRPFTLILDDYHAITNPEIHEELAFLLNRHLPQLHLVIITRADPPLSLARLRASRLLTELRVDDLRFTLDETRALFNDVLACELSPADLQALADRTEGWIVGLIMAAQSMQSRVDKHAFIAAFSGSHHFVLNYLIEEVLSGQPKSVRMFLLKSAILDRMGAAVCDEVLDVDNSHIMLERLVRHNLFIIPLDEAHHWFRYHQLFADLLRAHLRKDLPAEAIQSLHRRASQWYEQAGDLERAVKHALSGKDFLSAAALIERAAEGTIAHGRVKPILQWITALPVDLVRQRPDLQMIRGWATFLTGQVNAASEILQEAQGMLHAGTQGQTCPTLRGKLSAALATITTLERDLPRAIREAEEALDCLPTEERIWRARAIRALGIARGFSGDTTQLIEDCAQAKNLALHADNKFLGAECLSQIASALRHQGKLNQAAATYHRIVALVRHPGSFPPAGLGYIGLGSVALERSELHSAGRNLDIGIDLCNKGGIGYMLQTAYCKQAILRQAQGDRDGALNAMRLAEQRHTAGSSLDGVLNLIWHQMRLKLLMGDVDGASQWACGEGLPGDFSLDALPIAFHEIYQVLQARVMLAQGRFRDVLSTWQCVTSTAQPAGRLARVMEMDLYKALALYTLGEVEGALGSLVACLSLAVRESYVRLFVEAGDPVKALLEHAFARAIYPDYARKLLAALEPPCGSPGQSLGRAKLIEYLTDREFEVLRFICQGYTNAQIAGALIVSTNTIKKHTSNLYGKLGVRNRAQAVLRAQELDLL